MTGRGIDQVLPYPSVPTLYEPALDSARAYVELAERFSGPIACPVPFSYIWGDALQEMQTRTPDLRIINLETGVTASEEHVPKGINYRMNPANVPCLAVAGIDCCILANNHVLDWGAAGLRETLETLGHAGIATAGAGSTEDEAARPAVFPAATGRVVVFAFGSPTSGIPASWAASGSRPGVNYLPDLSQRTAARVASRITSYRQRGDLVIVSIHWGENWGYEIPQSQGRFAHELIDAGAADLVHGHSSHHAKGIEVYKERLILYGCGDFIDDYEGIAGYENFRPELALAYFAELDEASGSLAALEMAVFQSRRLRLEHCGGEAVKWLQALLNREGEKLGTRVELTVDSKLKLRW
jgi:poly-gamma-glutamate synthesis protein (capsule biosynthesis protein)